MRNPFKVDPDIRTLQWDHSKREYQYVPTPQGFWHSPVGKALKLFVPTLEAIWAVSSQPILIVHAMPAGLLMGIFKMAYGGRFPNVSSVRMADFATDAMTWLFLLYLDFKVMGWHPYFFAGWMLSACLANIAQKRWRKAAGLPADMADYEESGR